MIRTERDTEVLSGNCPPERPCTRQMIAAYRALFGEGHWEKCVHFGEATGERLQCETCTGKVMVKVFACALHGQCTIEKEVGGLSCCSSCPDFSAG